MTTISYKSVFPMIKAEKIIKPTGLIEKNGEQIL